MEIVTTAGFLILITLMVLAIGLDINRFSDKRHNGLFRTFWHSVELLS